jgi:hypothetical protein
LKYHLTCALAAAAFLMLPSGCGGKPQGKVSGTVTYQGQELPSGTVAFQGAGDWSSSSNIHAGRYEIEGIPPGPVKATVLTFPPSPAVVPPNTPLTEIKQTSLKYVEVPATYHDFGKTPLSFDVKAGSQKWNIALKADGS